MHVNLSVPVNADTGAGGDQADRGIAGRNSSRTMGRANSSRKKSFCAMRRLGEVRGVSAEAVENALTFAARATAHPASGRTASGGDALAGLLHAGHRRGASDQAQSLLLPLLARQVAAPHHYIAVPHIFTTNPVVRQPGAPAARMILPHLSTHHATNTRLRRE